MKVKDLLPVKVPLKPRDTRGQAVLAAKRNAGGRMASKADKTGRFEKHKGRMYEADLAEDTLTEKKPAGAPEWHDSDAPDANGKFKELGINDLADWLIRTRGGNMQKITGSLNQQIVFNRNKNPSYAKKMESVRAAIKRKLAKRDA